MRLKQSDIEFACIVLWFIWQNRNDVVWNGRSQLATSIFQSAIQLLYQWKAASMSAAPLQQTPQFVHSTIWKPPPANYLKCNTDVVVFEGEEYIGFDCILRNSHGLVIDAIYGTLRSFSFAYGSANQVVHALVRKAVSLTDRPNGSLRLLL
ncbi:uncharacterized protein [Henckelia pumila]|uniref:uncharacterized protein n=1 Tax=Henckelia pumila TaxID=405737 RepID=UPI003C6E5255